MHAAMNYPALSPLQLPLPYLPAPSPPPLLPPPMTLMPLLSPPSRASLGAGFQSRISPSILLSILILAVLFFVSGLLHLLARFLFRPAPPDPDSGDANATAFQGQLQQLFHLHDASVDQSFIDALPVFLYGAVMGTGGKDPFGCAVCLCELDDDDRLRLLPKCSHAFHVECIDTWLLSHSTCPLCRRSLLADLFSPCSGAAARWWCQGQKHPDVKDEVVVPVKLGKLRSQGTEAGAGSSDNSDQDVRRCYSMGTYERAPLWARCRRVSSFRLPSALQRAASDIGAPKRQADVMSPVTESEYNVSAWDKSASGSVADWDVESGSATAATGLSSRADEALSFATRTLLWIRMVGEKEGSIS
ncbi:unnamed protein product [Alopecurus aequalis]